MDKQGVEHWALDIVDRASKGEAVESERVELKRAWSDPRNLVPTVAALANTATEAGALLLVGIDESGAVLGADPSRFPAWWNAMQEFFLGRAPRIQMWPVAAQGKEFCALLVSGDGGPFLVRGAKGQPRLLRRIGEANRDVNAEDFVAAWTQGRTTHIDGAEQRAHIDKLQSDLAAAEGARQSAEAELKKVLQAKRPTEVEVAEIGALVEKERIAKSHELELLNLQHNAEMKKLELESARVIADLEANTKRAVAAETSVESVRANAQKRTALFTVIGVIVSALLTSLVTLLGTRGTSARSTTVDPSASATHTAPAHSASAPPMATSATPLPAPLRCTLRQSGAMAGPCAMYCGDGPGNVVLSGSTTLATSVDSCRDYAAKFCTGVATNVICTYKYTSSR